MTTRQSIPENEISAFDELFGEETRIYNDIKENGFALSELKSDFLIENFSRVQPKQMFRFDLGQKRYYYNFVDKLNTCPQFFISVTSSIANPFFLETSKYLIEYYTRFNSIEDAYKDMNKKADYGTFCHILISEFLKRGTLNLNEIPAFVETFRQKSRLDYDNRFWSEQAKRDIIAVERWIKEHAVKPIAVELVMSHADGYASAVDLLCKMKFGSGVNGKILKKDNLDELPEVTVIVDWKTGKAFYDAHALQLEAYRRLVEYNFPDVKVDKLINIRFEGGWRNAHCIMKEQTLGQQETTINGLSVFDMEWNRYKSYHPNYNNPHDFDEVNGYVDIEETDTYEFNPRNPRDIVVEKHRKY